MILSPKTIIEKWMLLWVSSQDQIQQNWIDLTLKSVAKLVWQNELLHDNRQHCDREPIEFDCPDWTALLSPWAYEILYNEEFNIPNGVCASIYTRSTIIRGWNFIASWLYDAGFKWTWGWVLHVFVPLLIQLNVRVGQVVFMQAEEWELYQGIYNDKTHI